MKKRKGVYQSTYGNAIVYLGGSVGYDIDAGVRVPVSEIRFDKFIRKLDEADRALASSCKSWF